jgi:hypothetical protein
MAKKKAKKLPKTIGGVKIPKKVRKQGGELLAKVNTPMGRELLAAGLVAAGAAMAKREETRKAAARVAGEAEDAAAKGARLASEIGGIVGAAANAALDRLLGSGGRRDETSDRPAGPPPGSTAH